MRNSYLFLFLSFFCACQTPAPSPSAPVKYESDTTSTVHTEQKVAFEFSNVVDIDSMEWLGYPIGVERGQSRESSEYSLSGYSKNSDDNNTFHNILFYNTKTKESHLLDTAKMVIHQFATENKRWGKIANRFVFYQITRFDTNKDGILNHLDPEYLFVSDKSGKNLRQITPNDASVLNWYFPRQSDFMLIRVRKDSNRDGIFDFQTDNESLLRVDFTPEPTMAYEVFPNALKQQLQGLLDKQWKKKG